MWVWQFDGRSFKMSAQAFGAFIQHESSDSLPTAFAKVLHRDAITQSSPPALELEQLEWGKRLDGPHPIEADVSIPPTPRELEASQPPTPKHGQAIDALMQSATTPYKNRWRLASATVMFLLMGMNDAAVSEGRYVLVR
jgi:hypothetical protein